MSDKPSADVSAVFAKLAPAIRAASGLSSNDINFYKSLDQDIASSSSKSSDGLLSLINQIVASVEASEVQELDEKTTKESWNTVSNLLDTFLERSDLAFDELRRGKDKSNNSATDSQSMKYLDDSNSVADNAQSTKRMVKPQLKFTTPIDNSESHPFKPLLTSKPHALVSLEKSLVLTEADDESPSHYNHPYEAEIMNQEYNPSILETTEPQMYKDWDSTEAIWVDNEQTLQEMVESLHGCTEIAVDLEHHDYRSYYGIVCLMQISSRDQDWLVDTLALRDKLQPLNTIFADPFVTKVFHGAFMDIIWLQRDLGLYVVSLFDTYHASKQLGFPKHSLAYLLERFAQFKTSKKYQLADWRIRPLTKPMRAYARSDTHFLLYIFDQLRNMLIESSKLENVLFESRNVAVRRFEYTKFRPLGNQTSTYSPIEKDDPWKRLVYQYNIPQSRSKLVEVLYNWRDQIAREDDESPRYVMPNQLLVSLASLAPTDAAGVLAASAIVTDHVRKNCKHIADLISHSLKELEREDFQLFNDATGMEKSELITYEEAQKHEDIFESLKDTYDVAPVSLLSSYSTLLHDIIEGSSGVFRTRSSGSLPSDFGSRKRLVQERLAVVNVSLNLELDEEMSDSVADVATGVAQVPTPVTSSAQVTADDDEIKIFDKSDDIIVLKKKGKATKQERKSQPAGEILDYSKAPSVMAKKAYESKKDMKKRQQERFEPYSQESEGPRPAKKQARMLQGKTSTFVTKKKK